MENYIKFLSYMTGRLNKYFKDQSPYIKCKLGCSKCCSNGDYPFSQMELDLLKQGFVMLDGSTQQVILENIDNIKKAKAQHTGVGRFTYKCPFLIDDKCSVYLHRGLICRTFGLIYIKKDEKMKIPFCAYEGLNYSNVLDEEKNMLVYEKMHELGITVEPVAYNIHYDFITSEKIEHAFGFKYGKKGSLIDLLLEDEFFTKKLKV